MKKQGEKLSDIIKIGTVHCSMHKHTFLITIHQVSPTIPIPHIQNVTSRAAKETVQMGTQAGPQETHGEKQRVTVATISLATAPPTTEIIPGH